jgi:hypothetical protein
VITTNGAHAAARASARVRHLQSLCGSTCGESLPGRGADHLNGNFCATSRHLNA